MSLSHVFESDDRQRLEKKEMAPKKQPHQDALTYQFKVPTRYINNILAASECQRIIRSQGLTPRAHKISLDS